MSVYYEGREPIQEVIKFIIGFDSYRQHVPCLAFVCDDDDQHIKNLNINQSYGSSFFLASTGLAEYFNILLPMVYFVLINVP